MNVRYLSDEPLALTRRGSRKTLTKGDVIDLSKDKVKKFGEHRFEGIQEEVDEGDE